MVALGLKLHRLFYGQRRQVNRKSPERTEDDLPVPLTQYVNLLRNQCTTIGCRSCVNNDYTYSCISSCRLLHVCQSVSHLEIKNYT